METMAVCILCKASEDVPYRTICKRWTHWLVAKSSEKDRNKGEQTWTEQGQADEKTNGGGRLIYLQHGWKHAWNETVGRARDEDGLGCRRLYDDQTTDGREEVI
jgi:hypothetical protein